MQGLLDFDRTVYEAVREGDVATIGALVAPSTVSNYEYHLLVSYAAKHEQIVSMCYLFGLRQEFFSGGKHFTVRVQGVNLTFPSDLGVMGGRLRRGGAVGVRWAVIYDRFVPVLWLIEKVQEDAATPAIDMLIFDLLCLPRKYPPGTTCVNGVKFFWIMR